MSTPEFLPWQKPQAVQWLAQRNRFAHAWLIHGQPGVGQLEFAMAGAASLLCEQPDDSGLACGHCRACGWVQADNHPDLRRIRPEATAAAEEAGKDAVEQGGQPGTRKKPSSSKSLSRDIRVDQIRGLLPWFNTASHRGGWRVAILYPAESLNTISANALLKILEEPPANTVFLLAARAPDRLLPTLVSRCRRVPLSRPPMDDARQWLSTHGVDDAAARLAAAGGAPLLAQTRAARGEGAEPPWLDTMLELATRGGAPATLADQLLSCDTAEWIDGMQRLWLDLSLSARGLPPHYFPGRAQAIRAISRQTDPGALAKANQWLLGQRRTAQHALSPKFLAEHAAQYLLQSLYVR